MLLPESRLLMLTKKESCHKLSLLLLKSARVGGGDGGGQIVGIFTNTEVSYLVVSLVFDLVPPLFY